MHFDFILRIRAILRLFIQTLHERFHLLQARLVSPYIVTIAPFLSFSVFQPENHSGNIASQSFFKQGILHGKVHNRFAFF